MMKKKVKMLLPKKKNKKRETKINRNKQEFSRTHTPWHTHKIQSNTLKYANGVDEEKK